LKFQENKKFVYLDLVFQYHLKNIMIVPLN